MGLAISIKDGSQRSVHISAERDVDLHLSTNLLGTARDFTPPGSPSIPPVPRN